MHPLLIAEPHRIRHEDLIRAAEAHRLAAAVSRSPRPRRLFSRKGA
ncbi:hypothetical protein AB0M20_24820 [Actinoplanes sp. NPDC051633]